MPLSRLGGRPAGAKVNWYAPGNTPHTFNVSSQPGKAKSKRWLAAGVTVISGGYRSPALTFAFLGGRRILEDRLARQDRKMTKK
jgi:hypothetical protein